MRRLLSFLFLINVGMACDFPHEEIGGFQLGCIIENPQNALTEKIDKSVVDQQDTQMFIFKTDGFFDQATLEVDDDNRIFAVVFQKKYFINKNNIAEQKYRIREDFQDFYYTLTDRWGKTSEETVDLLLTNQQYSDFLFLRKISQQMFTINKNIQSDIVTLINFQITSGNEDYLRGWDQRTVNFILTYAIDKKGSSLMPSKNRQGATGF